MKTATLRSLRAALLTLAAVVAWGGAAAQDSPGASKGFDRYGRRIDHFDHDADRRHDHRRRASRYELSDRDRAESRRLERERRHRQQDNDRNAWQRQHDRYDRDRDRDRNGRGYFGGERSGKSHPFVRDPGANGG